MTAPAPRRLKALCLFCGSQPGRDPAYAAAAFALGEALARHGTTLVFGGGRVGLMGAACDGVLNAGGKVTGVIPEFLKAKELAHPGATEMITVADMHTRKRIMAERADAFCVLPGGVGTMDEAFEIITWRQLHIHHKPIVVLDVGGYWKPLIALLDRMAAEGFAHHGHAALLTVVSRVEDAIAVIEDELARPKARVAFPSLSRT